MYVGGVGAAVYVSKKNSQELHAPAPPPAQNHDPLTKKNSEDAPRPSAFSHPKQLEGRHSEQNSQDAPRTSAATRPKPQEGRRVRRELSGRSTRQRCHLPQTTGRPSITKRILRMLHAPATPPAENHEKVVDYEQDAPRASAATPPKTTRRSSIANRLPGTLHAPAPPPTRRSSITNRTRTLQAPAPPPAGNHQMVVDYDQNSEDAPRASAATRPKPTERRRLRTEI